MKPLLTLLFIGFSAASSYASEIIKIKLFDGDTLTGQLALPAQPVAEIKQLIIFVHGTGPGTYLSKRKMGNVEFNYFDLFSDEFTKRGIAFFTYNKRGVTLGDTPPYYDQIDKEKHKKCLPNIEVKDILTLVQFLKGDKRFKKSKIVLFGFSEGTILAAMAAESKKSGVDALFLGGYVNENLYDVIAWQNTGGSSMVNIRKFFDVDRNNIITRQEYDAPTEWATRGRTNIFKNATFDQLDVNKDTIVNSEDFKMINSARYKSILDAIDRQDDEWIWTNYFRISTAWLKEHFTLEANKNRLLKLDIPIYIFHGEDDGNAPVEGVYDIEKRFKENKKTNLHAFVFKDHGHGLNYMDWVRKKEISEATQKIFDVAESLNGLK